MKIFELLRLGTKNTKGRWVVLPVIGIAISVFCLCFAGAIFTTVENERSLPYEIAITNDGAKKVSDSTLAEISKLSDVTAISPLLQVPATVRTGKYVASMNLTGIDPSYISDKFATGSVFAASSGMPHIVINKAETKQFSVEQKNTSTGTQSNTGNTQTGSSTDAKSGTSSTQTGSSTGAKSGTSSTQMGSSTDAKSSTSSTQTASSTDVRSNTNTNTTVSTDNKDETTDTIAPKINWLNVSYTLEVGGGDHLIVSKICGILAGDDKMQQPEAYISLTSAKNLLQKSGQSTAYVGAKVRIKNIGFADSVSKAIQDLGFIVTNNNTILEAKWDSEVKEMTYLIVIGVFSLLCSAVLMVAWRKISVMEQREAWKMLLWMGMKEKDIHKVFVIQSLMISLIGIVIGIIVSISLPSFMPTDTKEISVYTLLIPYLVLVLSSVICIFVVMLSMLSVRKQTRLI